MESANLPPHTDQVYPPVGFSLKRHSLAPTHLPSVWFLYPSCSATPKHSFANFGVISDTKLSRTRIWCQDQQVPSGVRNGSFSPKQYFGHSICRSSLLIQQGKVRRNPTSVYHIS